MRWLLGRTYNNRVEAEEDEGARSNHKPVEIEIYFLSDCGHIGFNDVQNRFGY